MVPDAWIPGTLLMVGAPDGRTMKVGVPAGLRPGDYFVVVFPSPAQPPLGGGAGAGAGVGAVVASGEGAPSGPDEDSDLAEAMRMSLAEEREKAELERQLVGWSLLACMLSHVFLGEQSDWVLGLSPCVLPRLPLSLDFALAMSCM